MINVIKLFKKNKKENKKEVPIIKRTLGCTYVQNPKVSLQLALDKINEELNLTQEDLQEIIIQEKKDRERIIKKAKEQIDEIRSKN